MVALGSSFNFGRFVIYSIPMSKSLSVKRQSEDKTIESEEKWIRVKILQAAKQKPKQKKKIQKQQLKKKKKQKKQLIMTQTP